MCYGEIQRVDWVRGFQKIRSRQVHDRFLDIARVVLCVLCFICYTFSANYGPFSKKSIHFKCVKPFKWQQLSNQRPFPQYAVISLIYNCASRLLVRMREKKVVYLWFRKSNNNLKRTRLDELGMIEISTKTVLRVQCYQISTCPIT